MATHARPRQVSPSRHSPSESLRGDPKSGVRNDLFIKDSIAANRRGQTQWQTAVSVSSTGHQLDTAFLGVAKSLISGAPKGNRTPVSALRGLANLPGSQSVPFRHLARVSRLVLAHRSSITLVWQGLDCRGNASRYECAYAGAPSPPPTHARGSIRIRLRLRVWRSVETKHARQSNSPMTASTKD
jgi:hypothetical protein